MPRWYCAEIGSMMCSGGDLKKKNFQSVLNYCYAIFSIIKCYVLLCLLFGTTDQFLGLNALGKHTTIVLEVKP